MLWATGPAGFSSCRAGGEMQGTSGKTAVARRKGRGKEAGLDVMVEADTGKEQKAEL